MKKFVLSMKQKYMIPIPILLSLAVLAGCTRSLEDFSSAPQEIPPAEETESSSQPDSSSPPEDEPVQRDPMPEFVFSAVPEIPGSLELSPTDLFSQDFCWIDSTRLYLFPLEPSFEEAGLEYGAIVDIENRTVKQAPGHTFRWRNIGYQEDGIVLENDSSEFLSLYRLDREMNLLSTVFFGSGEEYRYKYDIHPAAETIYYIQDDDPEKPLLWRRKGEQSEIAAELPPLRAGEEYEQFQLSPDGDMLYLYRIYNGLRVNCIFVYDLDAQALLSATTRPGLERYPAGFWMPVGSWNGDQPFFIVDHEYSGRVQAWEGLNSIELLHGIPPESRAEVFYNPEEIICVMSTPHFGSGGTPWECVGYSVLLGSNRRTREDRLFYFRPEDNIYLSYAVSGNACSPQVSPDYRYLAYYRYGEEGSPARLCVIPTETFWKPLDWQQFQRDLEEPRDRILAQNGG